METRVYLLGDITKVDGFVAKEPVPNGTTHQTTYLFKGIRVYLDNGRWHVPFVPECLKDLVDEITLFSVENLLNKRESGVYRHKSAVAEVWCSYNNGAWRTEIKIRSSKTMEDANELREKILIGTIRPDQSFEEPQAGPSYDELKMSLCGVQYQVNEMRRMLQSLEAGLASARHPWASRKAYLAALRRILSVGPINEIG